MCSIVVWWSVAHDDKTVFISGHIVHCDPFIAPTPGYIRESHTETTRFMTVYSLYNATVFYLFGWW